MKIISGFLEPTSGQACIEGYNSHTQPIEARRRLGYLPEGAPAYADMSVADFLGFIAGMHGLSKRQANDRLAELVERIDLAEVWNQRIDALSKGFKRRVGIAQALVHDPDVLILDEPTDGLDPNQKYEMRELIRIHRAAKGDHHIDPHPGGGRSGLHPRHHHRQGTHAGRCDAIRRCSAQHAGRERARDHDRHQPTRDGRSRSSRPSRASRRSTSPSASTASPGSSSTRRRAGRRRRARRHPRPRPTSRSPKCSSSARRLDDVFRQITNGAEN